MGKRSNFARKELDTYDTPNAAVAPLLPHLPPKTRFIDPCAGAGDLIEYLSDAGHVFNAGYDIKPRVGYIRQADFLVCDRRTIKTRDLDCFITNPPWLRLTMHAFIAHCRVFERPAWMLIDANWMFTAQAEPFLRYCSLIVTVGRLKWIPGTAMTGKDDAAWFRFEPRPVDHTEFVGKVGKWHHKDQQLSSPPDEDDEDEDTTR